MAMAFEIFMIIEVTLNLSPILSPLCNLYTYTDRIYREKNDNFKLSEIKAIKGHYCKLIINEVVFY